MMVVGECGLLKGIEWMSLGEQDVFFVAFGWVMELNGDDVYIMQD